MRRAAGPSSLFVLTVLKEGGENVNPKKTWNQPMVIEFGNVETLTLASNKNFGTGDAFTFQSQTTKLSG